MASWGIRRTPLPSDEPFDGRFANGIHDSVAAVDTGSARSRISASSIDSPQDSCCTAAIVKPFGRLRRSSSSFGSVPLPGDMVISGTYQDLSGTADYNANLTVGERTPRLWGRSGGPLSGRARTATVPLVAAADVVRRIGSRRLDLRVSKILYYRPLPLPDQLGRLQPALNTSDGAAGRPGQHVRSAVGSSPNADHGSAAGADRRPDRLLGVLAFASWPGRPCLTRPPGPFFFQSPTFRH